MPVNYPHFVALVITNTTIVGEIVKSLVFSGYVVILFTTQLGGVSLIGSSTIRWLCFGLQTVYLIRGHETEYA